MTNNNEGSTDKPLFIKELIRRVHQELIDSQNEREKDGYDPLFYVEKLVIEANFAVVASKEKKGGLDFKLITIGGTKGYSEQQVHKVTLTLTSVPSKKTSRSRILQKPSKSTAPIGRSTEGTGRFPHGYEPAPP